MPGDKQLSFPMIERLTSRTRRIRRRMSMPAFSMSLWFNSASRSSRLATKLVAPPDATRPFVAPAASLRPSSPNLQPTTSNRTAKSASARYDRRAVAELVAAARAITAKGRKMHLNQAAIYAHRSEKCRW